MSYEQRAKMESYMKTQNAMGPQTHTHKSCMTKESVEKDLQWDDTARTHCKRTIRASTSRTQDLHEECSDERRKSSSDIHFQATDDSHVNGTVHSVITQAGTDHPMTMNMTIHAHWLSSSCGDIKPGS